MGWSGKINTWAWNKQVDIVRSKQRKEEEDYLKELKKNCDRFIFCRYGCKHYWCLIVWVKISFGKMKKKNTIIEGKQITDPDTGKESTR